ncbi:hypothetical protein [Pseudoruegeria sp. HB172150]|uniref:hypothetical protein n=1 Tax=Pseudoruegeria sp. HB172150 TaxID=2721164 RepID=UPI001554EEFE|nr:hypothetical protein [Pseudoruegeria sp. HB172150]
MSGLFRATEAERAAVLPGDGLVRDLLVSLDHGVTIGAPPEAVWPWLVQMGAGRAGWYSYDRLDNGGAASAWEILPEFQEFGIGTVMPALPGVTDCFVVLGFEAARWLLLGVPSGSVTGAVGSDDWRACFDRASWVFVLSPVDGGTRLHVRARTSKAEIEMPVLGRVRFPGVLARPAASLIHGIMARRQLKGIRARVEMGQKKKSSSSPM